MTRPMTRREFTDQIAYEYVKFDNDVTARHGADQARTPLDRRYAFIAGRDYVESGRYVPRTDPRYMDWAAFAREARKALPRMRRLVAEHDTDDA